MAVYSMTGYASLQLNTDNASAGSSQAQLGLEIRSVNSRFLDLSFKLSDELRLHEPICRELLTRRVRRGKVELRAYVTGRDADATGPRSPSQHALDRIAEAQSAVLNRMPDAQKLSVADVLRLTAYQAQAPETIDSRSVMAAVDGAMDLLLESRRREGARLADMLLTCTAQLRTWLSKALPAVPAAIEAQHARLRERFAQALEQSDPTRVISPQLAQERALTEAAAFAIRTDVTEELSRLSGHLDEIDSLLGDSQPAQTSAGGPAPPELGKRLDFMVQELHREANTLGSKACSLELTHIAMEMKILIEQMREQVQNIE